MSIDMLNAERVDDVFDLDVREIGEVSTPMRADWTEGCTDMCTYPCPTQRTCTGPTWPCCC